MIQSWAVLAEAMAQLARRAGVHTVDGTVSLMSPAVLRLPPGCSTSCTTGLSVSARFRPVQSRRTRPGEVVRANITFPPLVGGDRTVLDISELATVDNNHRRTSRNIVHTCAEPKLAVEELAVLLVIHSQSVKVMFCEVEQYRSVVPKRDVLERKVQLMKSRGHRLKHGTCRHSRVNVVTEVATGEGSVSTLV